MERLNTREVYALKVRIRFAKKGALVYIGHLDVMRYFQKLFRRAEIPVKYSEGFSPHQILSFSHPLPLGMESEGEYADVELTDKILTQDALERLKAESVPEIEILSFKELPDKSENAMASVKAARYYVEFKNGAPFDDISLAIDNLLKKKEIVITKTTKKSEKQEDIRPLIYELRPLGKAKVTMLISSGSSDNLKPEVVISELCRNEGLEIDKTDLYMKRIDQYTRDKKNNLISLDEIGNCIND